MARVTVEDCILKISNRFDLVMTAAQRSREVSAGARITVDRDNDKNPVVALREIADETIDVEQVQESLIRGLQKHVEIDEPETDALDSGFGEGLVLEAGASGLGPAGLDAEALDGDAAEKLGMQIEFGGGARSFADEVDPAALERER